MITTESLSQNLLKQISTVINGNQARAEDIKSICSNSEIFQANLKLDWKFSSVYKDEKVAGGKKAHNHFKKQNHFEHQTQDYHQHAAYNKSLRQDFLNSLISLSTSSLKESNTSRTFYHFEQFSFEETCSNCSGKGQNRCSSCGGKGSITCSNCGGSGRKSYPITTYDNKGNANGTRWDYRSCPSCSGGQCTCSNCSGRGSIHCSPCKGYGYFIITRAVSAVAIPNYRIGTTASFVKSELEDLLNSKGTDFCYEKITFDEVNYQETSDDEYQFNYSGEGLLLSQEFSLKSKTYQCYAFSNPPYPFIKPAIFDDLFADELMFLKDSVPENGKINKKKSFEFFAKYSSQPVLEQSMREIAKNRTETSQILGEKLEETCQGYISPKMAMELSGYLNKIMDKVSPAYSSFVWEIWAFIAFISSFIIIEDKFETIFSHSPFSTILTSFILVLFIICSGSIIAWLLSCLVTLIIRRKIPKEYRQKMRNKEPFKKITQCVFFISLLGAIYGYSANQDWLPKFNSAPIKWVTSQTHSLKEWLCTKSKKLDWELNICSSTQDKSNHKSRKTSNK
ncbi:TPA: hypothetical protein ACU21S_000390 [Mannheimia haemolytica]